MILNNEQIKEYEQKLHILYPFLSNKEVKDIVENILDYWIYVIEHLDDNSTNSF